MSMGGGTTTSTQKSDPWAPAQPFLLDLMRNAQSTYQSQVGNNQMPSTYVAPSATTQQALDLTAQRAQSGSDLTRNASSALTGLMQPQNSPGGAVLTSLLKGYADPGADIAAKWADPNSINPYLTAQYNAASRPVIDSVNAQAALAGRTGSGANQQLLTRNLGDLSANIFSQGYENAANRSLAAAGLLSNNAGNQANVKANAANSLNSTILNASALAPTLANQDYVDLQKLLTVGAAKDMDAQNQNNSILQQFQYSQQQPWNILNGYAGAISGLGNLGGTSTATQTQPGQSILPALLGAGLTVGLAPSSSLLGGWLSDARLKTDVTRIGATPNGLNLYSYRFRGSDRRCIGLMAQEVERLVPKAVTVTPSGYKTVNYHMALAA